MLQHVLWVEKYRPTKLVDVILPSRLQSIFQGFIDNREVPNCLLVGPPGTGKTTVARVLLETLGHDYIFINGSLNGNIDTLRNQIVAYAATVSFEGTRKFVLIDEADYLSTNTQVAIRGVIEEFAKNCGFIFTCNYRARIIEPLQSRLVPIEFDIPPDEGPKLAAKFLKRCETILQAESVPYDREALVAFISKNFPDWRRILNELHVAASRGAIDVGILANNTANDYDVLMRALRAKNFEDVRVWVFTNTDREPIAVMRAVYEYIREHAQPASIANTVILFADYQAKAAVAVDQAINLLAFLVEVMNNVVFRD